MNIKIKKESNEVFYYTGDLINLDKKFIDEIINKCEKSNFKKSRYCFHKNKKSKVQEMIICHKKEYYVRPHKHIDKEESIFVIKGYAKAIFFDDSGEIKEIIKLGEIGSKKAFYYKLNKKFFHMLLIESEYFIFHEVSNSPFKKNKTIFAKWSPVFNNLFFQKSLKKKIKAYEKNI
jgi:cupin fold WbuC family metalloprotein